MCLMLAPKEFFIDSNYVCSIEAMEGDVGDERWWLNARQTARQLRAQWTFPTDYYSSVKVMTNEPFLKGKCPCIYTPFPCVH